MVGIGLVLALTVAVADDALTRQQIVEAEWSRDVSTLIEGPYELADLPLVARALGRTRDPAVLPRLALLANQSDIALRREASAALGFVPGSAPHLRERLALEREPALRAILWRGLGRQGDEADVAPLVAALPRPWPEGAAAATALGLLARRGVDAGAAVPSLVAALAAPDARRLRAVAYALHRIAPVTLTVAEQAAVREAWDRAPHEATRAWLLPTLLAHTPVDQRRILQVQVLAGPWRAARTALLDSEHGGPWTEDDLRHLADDPDPWVAHRAREILAGHAAPSPREVALSAAAGGQATPEQQVALLSAALTGDTPRERSRAAAALLAGGPTEGALTGLAGADDHVVRELVATALAERADPDALARLEDLLRTEQAPTTLVAVLDGIERALVAGGRVSPATALRLRDLATRGDFLVRQRAHRAARAAGVILTPVEPVLPGPADLERDLDAIAALRSVRVFTTDGEFRVTLAPDVAPLAVASFAHLAQQGWFDGVGVHRVVPGFVVQTGDPRGDGMGGPGWFLPDEVSDQPFVAGSVGITTAGPDTGGSQWFVTTTHQPHLAGQFTRLGTVTHGLDVVRGLDEDDVIEAVVIERVPAVGP